MRVLLELVRRHSHESFLNVQRRLAFRDAGAVGDTKYMRVDGDCRFAEGGVEYDVGRFSSDPGQRLQFIACPRHFARVLLDEHAASRYDIAGFSVEKADGAYIWGQAVDAECEDRFGRLLAYVYVGDTEIHSRLVENGYARQLHIPPNGDDRVDEFVGLETQARNQGRGMWGQCETVTCD